MWLLLLIGAILAFGHVAAQQSCQAKIDLVFVMDSSGSIRNANPSDGSIDNWSLILEFANALVEGFDIGQDYTQVGSVTFGNVGNNIFYLNTYSDKNEIQSAILSTSYLDENTNTSGGLKAMMNDQFVSLRGDRADAFNVAIVLTDGVSTYDNHLTLQTAEAARNLGIKIYSIGVTTSIKISEVQGISSHPQVENENWFAVAQFSDLATLVDTIIGDVCVSGGSPTVTTTTTTAAPAPAECANLVADLVLVVDSSGSIRESNPDDNSYDNWELLKRFLKGIVNILPISNGDVRIGLVEYSSLSENIFFLNDYSDANEINTVIDGLIHFDQTTNTSGAIKTMNLEQFTSARGDRSNVQNVAFVLTDGASNVDEGLTISSAEAAHSNGINVVSLGITNNVVVSEVSGISSDPHQVNSNYFLIEDFTNLEAITSMVASSLCGSAVTPSPPVAVCTDQVGDIVFVVDSSGSIREANPTDGSYDNWDLLLGFLSDLTDILNVSQYDVRIGLVEYSDQAENIFYLNSYYDKASIKNAIVNMRFLDQRTNTSGGIRVMHEQQFIASRGDRDNVPNIALILTDGESNLDQARTVSDAVLARADKIDIISLGITDSVNMDEVKDISSEPHTLKTNYFLATDFTVLDSVASGILNSVCHSTSTTEPSGGSVGATGATGAAGFNGAAGSPGANGLDGSNGAQGPPGAQGITGAQGALGNSGNPGINGADGDDGANGANGQPGTPGSAGAPGIGSPGASGLNGSPGRTGATGAAGADGSDGAAGLTGVNGLNGNPGINGRDGAQGIAGSNGNNGIDGVNGVNGRTGATGTVGLAGANGSSGINGADGSQGRTGATGQAGSNGVNGASGSNGTPGAAGIAGSNGRTGATGGAGSDGSNGSPGVNGSPGSNGRTGATGSAGANGGTGATGHAGVNGNPGANGFNGRTGATGSAGQNGGNGSPGANGQNGRTGATGTAGVNGNNGATGLTGGSGRTGATGPAGANGDDGSNGANGSPGADGSSGRTGATGAVGSNGGNGADGRTGATGGAGADGGRGQTGATGAAGVGRTGATGAAGTAGSNGAPGIGAAGPSGRTGATGSAGPSGTAGSPGSNGLTGPSGRTGATGSAGNDGNNGQTGGTGSTGPSGPSGNPGFPGQAGNPGVDGNDGTNGVSGATGGTGLPGNTGDTGPAGSAGRTGATGSAGGNGQTGGTGAAGSNGRTGSTGTAGSNGAPGSNGSPGQEGTSGRTGATGSAGTPGSLGNPGIQGNNGSPGVAGSSGRTGATGANGQSGPQGNPGNNGGPGSSGRTGATGSVGGPGSTGTTGQAGSSGRTGATGTQGNPGPSGLSGSNGRSGATGSQGIGGSSGPAGVAGPSGPNGRTGSTGHAGSPGVDGGVGPQGFPGSNGAAGPSGRTGATGNAGADGNHGLNGNPGPSGSNGQHGTTGMTGPRGLSGATGTRGPTGNDGGIGAPGTSGRTGGTGAAGPSGSQGIQGPSGPSGSQGNSGPSGITGATGTRGPSGDSGATGPAGVPGQNGAVGPSGSNGQQGNTGLTGPLGATGLKGDQGNNGIGRTGATGAQGSDGGQGPSGFSGHTGGTGHTGSQGLVGISGPIGATGPQGAAGIGQPGSAGNPGANGAQGPAGPQGSQGPSGPSGQTGPAGPSGPSGPTGPAGADGVGGGCSSGNECSTNNGGCAQDCIDTYDSYYCRCREGYDNVDTPITCPGANIATCGGDAIADIVFVVDSSGSIRDKNPSDGSYDNWSLLLLFVADVVDGLNVGSDGVRIGLVEYSNKASNVFFLNEYFTRAEIRTQVTNTPYLGGTTNTSGGLNLMRLEQFTSSRGDRSAVQNIAIVITDGESNEDQDRTIQDAEAAVAAGIEIIAIGVTGAINVAEVSGISSPPQTEGENWFQSAEFTILGQIVDHIVDATCSSSVDTCFGQYADLVFVVDSSGSIRDHNPADNSYDNWHLILSFVNEIIQQVDIDGGKYRIGILRYSEIAENVLFLNNNLNSADLQSSILATGYMGSFTNTSGGLRLMYEQQFTAGNGDRSDAQNIAIVITDGVSNVDEDRTISDAETARARGISIFSVGITDQIDEQELKKISSVPQVLDQQYFTAPDFQGLSMIVDTITKQTCDSASLGDMYCRFTEEARDYVCFCEYGDCDKRPVNGSTCQNINECAERNGGCQQNCVDTEGSFYCTCQTGFTLSADLEECNDVNECDSQVCDSGKTCINTYGSYYCVTSADVTAGTELLVAAPVAVATSAGTTFGTSTVILSTIIAFLVGTMLVMIVVLGVRRFKRARAQPDSLPSRTTGTVGGGISNWGFNVASKFGNADNDTMSSISS